MSKLLRFTHNLAAPKIINTKYFIRSHQNIASFTKSLLKNPSEINRAFPENSYESRTINKLLQGLKDKKRSSLAESITLVESSHPIKKLMGQVLLQLALSEPTMQPRSQIQTKCAALLKESHNHKSTLRIGMTGPPGAGKSTFIETFGLHLVRNYGLKVAVLAIDPSSTRTGGSLLGDKTRMSELSLEGDAYVRPSSARGEIGGVARNTTEALTLCESAGYDVTIVETVGVGQSEAAVADMTDVLVLVIPPAGGDELQGLKRGIVESADVVLVSKSDGDLIPAARRIQTEYTSALKFIPRKHEQWHPVVARMSSKTGDGVEAAWRVLLRFYDVMGSCGALEDERRKQRRVWMWNHIRSSIFSRFKKDEKVMQHLQTITNFVDKKDLTSGIASDILLNQFFDC